MGSGELGNLTMIRLLMLLLTALVAGNLSAALAQSPGAASPPSTAPLKTAPPLTPGQQSKIRDSVKAAKVDHAARMRFPVAVGAEVPRNLHFYPLPKEIAEVAPEYRDYFYVVAEEKIVVIDPLSYRIVAVLPT